MLELQNLPHSLRIRTKIVYISVFFCVTVTNIRMWPIWGVKMTRKAVPIAKINLFWEIR